MLLRPLSGPRPRAAALACVCALAAVPDALAQPQGLPRLKVSENRRFLVSADGRPFFWLADTAWELFHRLDREQAERYLRNRAERRFTVIQAVALAELDGLQTPNPYGARPLLDNDPAKPDEKYFAHVDWIVAKANALGLYVGMLPTWGDKWNQKRGAGPEVFTPANAEQYGAWLGQRYKEAGIVWILGGDRAVETDGHREITRAMARGIRRGDGGAHLITFHPPGGGGSSTWFHDEDWLDFNMRQNGHVTEFTGRYDQTRVDYDRTPTKPVVDGEPIYEDHPVSFDAKKLGHSMGADVRRPLYLGPLFRRFRAHLRTPLGLADVGAGTRAGEQPVDAVARGHRPAGRSRHAARSSPARVAPLPDAGARCRHRRHRSRGDQRARHRAVPLCGDA